MADDNELTVRATGADDNELTVRATNTGDNELTVRATGSGQSTPISLAKEENASESSRIDLTKTEAVEELPQTTTEAPQMMTAAASQMVPTEGTQNGGQPTGSPSVGQSAGNQYSETSAGSQNGGQPVGQAAVQYAGTQYAGQPVGTQYGGQPAMGQYAGQPAMVTPAAQPAMMPYVYAPNMMANGAAYINNGQPNLIIHYSSSHPAVALVTRIVATGRKDIYYHGQVIEYTVYPGTHQIILKIGKKNYARTILAPNDGSAVHIYAAYNGMGEIRIGSPYIVQCPYPIPQNTLNYVMTHTMRVDATVRAGSEVMLNPAYQQGGMAPIQTAPMQDAPAQNVAMQMNQVTAAAYSTQQGATAAYSTQQGATATYSAQPQVAATTYSSQPPTGGTVNNNLTALPIIAFVLSLSFFGSFVGLLLGIATACIRNIRLRGLGIAAIPIGAIFSLSLFMWMLSLISGY